MSSRQESIIVTSDHHLLGVLSQSSVTETKKKIHKYMDRCPMVVEPKLLITPTGFIHMCRGVRKLLYKEKIAKVLKRSSDSYPSVDSCESCEVKHRVDACIKTETDEPKQILEKVKIVSTKNLGLVPWVILTEFNDHE